MNNVRRSLNQYTNFISEKALSTDLEEVNRKSDITESDKSSMMATFSQKATEFLEKFEKRKYNQLVELSNIKLPEDKSGESIQNLQSTEHLLDPQPTC